MNYAEWKAAQQAGTEYDLQSGLTVSLKKVSLRDLAANGSIPSTLAGPIADLQKVAKTGNMGLEKFAEMGPIMDLVVSACLVSPVELTVEELSFDDKTQIFTWANEEAKQLAGFRK